jgi:hypothetical protein
MMVARCVATPTSGCEIDTSGDRSPYAAAEPCRFSNEPKYEGTVGVEQARRVIARWWAFGQ